MQAVAAAAAKVAVAEAVLALELEVTYAPNATPSHHRDHHHHLKLLMIPFSQAGLDTVASWIKPRRNQPVLPTPLCLCI